jgi:hypothetical protein
MIYKPLLSRAYATLYKAQAYVKFDIVVDVTFDIGGYITQLCHIYEPFIELETLYTYR